MTTDTHDFVKVVDGWGETSHGPSLSWIDTGSRHALEKMARQVGTLPTHVPAALATKIAELQGTLPRDKVAFYNRALGCFEAYGLNNNGDGWFRSELMAKHATFVDHAKYFRSHANQLARGDPYFGQPVASAYNPLTDMVDLIIVADFDKQAQEDIQLLERGQPAYTSMGCFVAGTMVTMADGTRRPIESIVVGDMVMTHLGRSRAVTELHRRAYKGEVYSIRGESIETIRCTHQHPFWAVKADVLYKTGNMNRYRKDARLSGSWQHASCLGDAMLLAPVASEVATPDYATPAFARLLGYYLAEGHIVYDKKKTIASIELTVNVNDQVLNEVDDLCLAFGAKNKPVVRMRTNSAMARKISISDKVLAEMCAEHAGCGARKKKLSQEVMEWHPDLQRIMIGAFGNGDGHGTKGGALKFSTASDDLAWQLTTLLPRIGVIPSIQNVTHKAGGGFNKHATYEWVIHVGKTQAQGLRDVCQRVVESKILKDHATRWIMTDEAAGCDYAVTPIREYSHMYAEVDVFNFEVEEDESYVVAGVAVHNCRVKHDVCTICKHASRSPAEYCEHVHKTASLPFGMGQILGDGRVCGVMNPDPVFFDISRLPGGNPAFRGSENLLKVASGSQRCAYVVGSGDRAIAQGLWSAQPTSKVAATTQTRGQKLADMIKRLPAEAKAAILPAVTAQKLDAIDGCGLCGQGIPAAKIAELAKRASVPGVLSAATALGLILSPDEFSALVDGVNVSAPTAVDILSAPASKTARDLVTGDVDSLVVAELMPYAMERSYLQPVLLNHVGRQAQAKTAAKAVSRGPVDKVASAAYVAYRRGVLATIDQTSVTGERQALKMAKTAARHVTPASACHAILAFCSDSSAQMLAKHSQSIDNRIGTPLVSGDMADDFGEDVLETMTDNRANGAK